MDLASGMTIDWIIANQDQGRIGGNQGQDEAAKVRRPGVRMAEPKRVTKRAKVGLVKTEARA